jgi:hypothetical protein
MERVLMDFLTKNGEEIVAKELCENFILHLICLFDYQQITNNTFTNVVQQLDSIRSNKSI